MRQIKIVDYATCCEDLHRVRMQVFVEEQGVPAAMEVDAQDPECIHVAAYDQGQCIGTGRMTQDGRIGRMAVMATHRGQGVGSSLLQALIAQARLNALPRVTLNSQVHACDFYRRHGFDHSGPVFTEAGIPHQAMVLSL